jgi:methyl-accepting chemotaxis protein
MRNELAAQVRRTDDTRQAATAAWNALRLVAASDELARSVENAEAAVKVLDAKRSQIGSLQLAGGDSFAYFTETIAKTLAVATEMSKLSTRGDITATMIAYVSFMNGKERAGQERATGAAGIAAGRFDASSHARMQALSAAQSAYFDAFKAVETTSTRDIFDQTVSGSVADAVNKMRQVIVTGGLADDFAGLDAKTWFDTTTARIDLLKKVEDRLGQDLLAQAAASYSAASQGLIRLGIGIVFAVSACFVLVMSVGRSIVRPVPGLTAGMKELASGNFDVIPPGLGRHDEVGDMAQAVETFKIKAAEKARREAEERQQGEHVEAEQMRLAEEREAAEAKHAAEAQDAAAKEGMHKVVGEFEAAVGGIIDVVSSSATELEATAGSLANTAHSTEEVANAVATTADVASTNVQSVASATEQLTASVREIGKQVQASSEIAKYAVSQAQKTDARVAELSAAASRIGDVVKLITAIAEQTNLLALNATIEAARAGDAGKGFAVVAQEVKALASQTAKATGEIGAQINGIQTATRESVTAIMEISDTIGRISEISGTIAAAVEEQSAATAEIARNVEQTANGTRQVSVHIADVRRHTGKTGAASSEMLTSAQSLSRESTRLKTEMERFLDAVRTGVGNRRITLDPDYSGPERRQRSIC